MELQNYTISWSTFLMALAVVALAALLTLRTSIGRNIVTTETSFSISQWRRLMLVIALTLFILVNPIYHLLDIAVFAILYYVLVSKDIFFGKKILPKGKNHEKNGIPKIHSDTRPVIICTPIDSQDSSLDRYKLDKCLFSFPYIKDNPKHNVRYLNGSYTIELSLSSADYMDSLIQFINKAGFTSQLKI